MQTLCFDFTLLERSISDLTDRMFSRLSRVSSLVGIGVVGGVCAERFRSSYGRVDAAGSYGTGGGGGGGSAVIPFDGEPYLQKPTKQTRSSQVHIFKTVS